MLINDICNIRTINPDGTASYSGKGAAWMDAWGGPDTVVYGHDAVKGLQVRPLSIGLDSGCCYGGALTALIWPENRLVSVPAARMYSQPTKPIALSSPPTAGPLSPDAAEKE